jgi:hypothetical protein
MYTVSDSQSFGVDKGRINDMGGFNDEGDRAFGRRKFSTGEADLLLVGFSVRRGLGASRLM